MPTFTVGSGPALEATVYADFDTGQAVYRIAGIGAFTLGWDPDHNPEADQDPMQEILQIAYGTGPLGFQMDEAVLFGVTLAGSESFTRAALDTGDLRLRPYRLIISAPVRVPKGTARRAAAIVSALAGHWLAQPWAPELRRAHEHHCAPRSLNRYGGLIAQHEERMRRLREEQPTTSNASTGPRRSSRRTPYPLHQTHRRTRSPRPRRRGGDRRGPVRPVR
ncbi:hypothetical protein ACFWYA_13035 [Streptomyces sp. NPDC059011]|uniref:hypothetical protein n=1 Tax=unclassified Streptomyces TaxID=2593676 RepID=UPI0036CB1272